MKKKLLILVSIFAIIILAAGPVFADRGIIRKNSSGKRLNVANAVVYLNGKQKGRGSISIAKIQPGKYRLKVVKDGYETYDKYISLKAGEATDKKVYLEKIVASSEQSGSVQQSYSSRAKETARDGHFIAYDDGTVLDEKTGLMWAAEDNGKYINWHDAKRYCESYQAGGYSDWRLPTIKELKGLYDSKTKLMKIIGKWKLVWSSEFKETKDGSRAAAFNFASGHCHWNPPVTPLVLPVRGGN